MEPRFHSISVIIAGRSYAGDWRLKGSEVCVGSAYGSRKAPVGRSTPEHVAEHTLAEIVRTWKSR